MEKQNFLERVKEIVGRDNVLKEQFVEVEWETGGCDGGNCWGDEAQPYYLNDPEPEFADLDKILNELCPKLPFSEYKSLLVDCVERDSRTSDGYYGNYTDYSIKRLDLDKLYNLLSKKRFI